jgi:hypothetical protein
MQKIDVEHAHTRPHAPKRRLPMRINATHVHP